MGARVRALLKDFRVHRTLWLAVGSVKSILAVPCSLRASRLGRIAIPADPEVTLRVTAIAGSVALERLEFTGER